MLRSSCTKHFCGPKLPWVLQAKICRRSTVVEALSAYIDEQLPRRDARLSKERVVKACRSSVLADAEVLSVLRRGPRVAAMM